MGKKTIKKDQKKFQNSGSVKPDSFQDLRARTTDYETKEEVIYDQNAVRKTIEVVSHENPNPNYYNYTYNYEYPYPLNYYNQFTDINPVASESSYIPNAFNLVQNDIYPESNLSPSNEHQENIKDQLKENEAKELQAEIEDIKFPVEEKDKNEGKNINEVLLEDKKIIKIENFDFEAYPETISKFWIPIDIMKNLYKFNPKFISNVELIKNRDHVTAWKKSRGDGNCYFRAVITRFFELIHKPYHFKTQIPKFIEALVSHSIILAGYKEFEQAKDYILAYLKNILSQAEKENSITLPFDTVLRNLQDPVFDKNLVMVSRLITASNLYKLRETDDIFPFVIDGYENVMIDMLEMGHEGGDESLLLLPKSLDIQVIQYMYLDKDLIVDYFPYNVSDEALKISIIRRSGHYDILCLMKEIELDQINLQENNYTFFKNAEYYDLF